MRRRNLFALGALAAAASGRAVTFTHAPLAGDDSIAWSQFGDASTGSGGSAPAGTAGTTALGRSFVVDTDANAIGGRLYSLDFPSGSTYDPISQRFTLATPVAAVSATVFAAWSSFGYHVAMEAFDAGGTSLGSVDQSVAAGVASVTLGAVSTLADIASVRYTVATNQPRVTSDFALSPVALRTQAVPEPAPFLVLGLGAALVRRRRPRG